MANKPLVVQCTEVSSSQEWATDPDLIEIGLTQAFLEKAEKCVAFLNEVHANEVTIWAALGYKMYQRAENLDDDELAGKKIVAGTHGDYAEFEPEYSVDGCHAVIDMDGDIRAEFSFEHTDDTLSCTVGNLSELQAQMAAINARSARGRTPSV